MKNKSKFIERFGKGIRGYGAILFLVVSVLLTISIVSQCRNGAELQMPWGTPHSSE